MRAPLGFLSVLALAAVAVTFFPCESSALPSYARQSGVSCFDCHSKTASGLNPTQLLRTAQPEELVLEGRTVLSAAPTVNLKAGLQIHSYPSSTGSEFARRLTSRSLYSELTGGQTIGANMDRAEALAGFSGFIGSDMFMASMGLLNPSFGFSLPYSDDKNTSIWYRFAFTPKVWGLDLTLGVFGASNKTDGNTLLSKEIVEDFVSVRSFGLDARIQGKIGKVSLDLKTVYSNIDAEEGAPRQVSKQGETSDSFSAMAQVGFNETFGFSASYRTYKTLDETVGGISAPEESATIGAWINIAENLVLQPQYTTFRVDERMTGKDGEFRLRFFSGF